MSESQELNMKPFHIDLLTWCDLVKPWPGRNVVTRQGALHEPFHPKPQAVQFVVNLQGGCAAGSTGFALRMTVTGAGPRLAH